MVREEQTGSVTSRQLGQFGIGANNVDELFVIADRCQSTAHIAASFTRATLFDPQRQLHDRGFESLLVLIDLESREGSRSAFDIVIPPWKRVA